MKKQDHELTGVELLRFVCAILVLLWHYQDFLSAGVVLEAVSPEVRGTFPLHSVLFLGYDYGFWAVQMFWVISGFIFYCSYAESIGAKEVGLLGFGVRRFSRLYPLHLVTLLGVTMLQLIYLRTHGTYFGFSDNSAGSFVFQMVFASNWFSWQGYSFNGPIWSVSAEIFIYVAFFLGTRALGPSALIAVAGMAISWALTKVALPAISPYIPLCGMYFFAGGAAQRLCRGRFALPLAGAAGITVLFLFSVGLIDLNKKSMLVLAISAVVFFAQLSATRARFVLRPASVLGNATYSSYFLHFPMMIVIVLCIDALGLSRNLMYTPPALLCYLAAVTAAAMATYHCFERPAQDRIRAAYVKRRHRFAARE